MKKVLISILLFSLLFASVSFAEETPAPLPDISSLDVQQLKELKESINARLIDLGALYEDIKAKSSGENVSLLQARLIELKYLEGEASGVWDKQSIAAMKDYEKAIGVAKPDGNASIAEQEAIYASDALVKPTPEPTPTPKPTPTPDPRKAYGKFDYKAVSRNPENFIAEKVKISGRVLQVMGSRTEGFTIRLATKGRYDNVVYLVIPAINAPDYNILDEDKLTVYATLAGDYTYTTTMGAAVTLPLASADIVEMTKK